jgi:hypothetical protein
LGKLLPQSFQGLPLAANLKEGSLVFSPLPQDLAVGENFPAQLLRRPGKKQFCFNQMALEKANDQPV